MTSSVVPRQVVAAPPAPVPHRFGLFSATAVIEPAEPHELNGIQYEAVCSTQVDPYPSSLCPADLTPDQRTKKPADTVGIFDASPFTVYAADSCVLGRDEATAREQLRQRFVAGEQTAVERAVETGSVGNEPYLRQAQDITPVASEKAVTGVDLPVAVGFIEQFLSQHYGGVGTIHAPRSIAPQLKAHTILDVNGGRASTVGGSSWVFGTGYTGEPPESVTTDDEKVWLYITPPLMVRRSRVIEPAGWTSGAFDKTQNTGLLLEERQYVVSWPCLTAAIKTSLDRLPPPPEPTDAAEVHTTSHIKELS